MSKIKKHPYLFILLYTAILAVFSYGFINLGDRQHDYFYHLARMLGLAQSISYGDWLPNLNFVFAKGIGFASPMFYGNWQFYLPAIVFIITKNASIAYTVFIFLIFLLTSYSSYYVIEKISEDKMRGLFAAVIMPLFYTWLGYGMTMTIMLVPLLIYSLYKVLYLDKRNPVLLGIVIALLVQTHILSTLVLAITSVVFVFVNIKLWTVKKVLSFIQSIGIAIFLSLGYVLQYLEQVRSQTFFVSWTLRDFPFPSEVLATSSGFFTNIVNYEKPLLILLIIYLLYKYKALSDFTKSLFITVILLFIMQSDILPWGGLLRYTFLATLQDTRRLVFFVPSFIVIILALSSHVKILRNVVLVQLIVYTFVSLNYLPLDNHIQEIRNTNYLAKTSFENISEGGFDTSGDEYFNISINHDNVRNGQLTKFDYDSSKVEVSNIKKTYNTLEFDVTHTGNQQSSEIALPLIWYKGYKADYSSGSSGSQPAISYRNLTQNEIQTYQQQRKPALTNFAQYDGRATILVEKSGHVKVYYGKTPMQLFGYLLELLAFLSVIIWYLYNLNNKKLQKVL